MRLCLWGRRDTATLAALAVQFDGQSVFPAIYN
jgi:hypothetical protein